MRVNRLPLFGELAEVMSIDLFRARLESYIVGANRVGYRQLRSCTSILKNGFQGKKRAGFHSTGHPNNTFRSEAFFAR